jgi:8-oxo-dGTP pyrophosphatase MutT (NUDIX family)
VARVDYYNDPDAPAANSIVASVTAVVLDDAGRLLLVHKTDNNLWALPGGGVDPGESVSDAVVREVVEETGIDVVVGDLVGVYTNPRHVMAYDDGEVRQQFSLCFRATIVGGSPRGSSETSEVEFVPLDQLDALSIHPSMRLRITHGTDPSRTTPYIG